jgi:anti-sigma B factor antagonist
MGRERVATLAIDVLERDGATVIRPGGERLDLEVAPEFRGAVLQLIKSGHRNLVVDLRDVAFIDSSGLGTLVSALKQLKVAKDRRRVPRAGGSRRPTARGDVKLANVQPSVAALLEIIRLNRVFSSYPSVEDAVKSFSS